WSSDVCSSDLIALLHANGLIGYVGAQMLLESAHGTGAAPLAAALAVWHAAIGLKMWARRRGNALHFIALAFTLLTIAVSRQFDGAWLVSAWAAEGALVVCLALREQRRWLHIVGLVLFAGAVLQLIFLQFGDPTPAWVLFNSRGACGLFVAGLAYVLALAHHRLAAPAERSLSTGISLLTAKLLVLSVALS